MKSRELINLGIPRGDALRLAVEAITEAANAGMKKSEIRERVREIAESPEDAFEDEIFGEFAREYAVRKKEAATMEEKRDGAPYRVFGGDIDEASFRQLKNACSLPVSIAGALMPDAHSGYGLPIGGVLAARNAVIPYAVGVDIACRMKMSVLDMAADTIEKNPNRLEDAIEEETAFGAGAEFRIRKQHAVMDRDWNISGVVKQLKDLAWRQLGTSGGGNHFVEFGVLSLERDDLGLAAGKYLALLSHSGSRGSGHKIATHYSEAARRLRPELGKELAHLAWLDLDTELGDEYWRAMELMGHYASANHDLVHRMILRNLGATAIKDIENHHNFAWKETYKGENVVTHRKGATPAAEGVVGIIPGSMAAPGFVIRGKGNPDSIYSASHGAGRLMSRTQAKKQFSRSEMSDLLRARGVRLISGGLDEAPMAYKDIMKVMAPQKEIVEIVARFDPKIVKMEPGGGGRRSKD